MGTVKISDELFWRLLTYLEGRDDPDGTALCREMEAKADRMIAHDLYTAYKTAETPEERDAARQKYLDRRGVPEDLRW